MYSKAHMALLEQTLDDADRIGATSISPLALSAPVATKVNSRWVAVSPDRWELRGLDGRKLGALVKMKDSSQWPGADLVDKWHPLPRSENYRMPRASIRAAAWELENYKQVRSSDASEENRQRAALLP